MKLCPVDAVDVAQSDPVTHRTVVGLALKKPGNNSNSQHQPCNRLTCNAERVASLVLTNYCTAATKQLKQFRAVKKYGKIIFQSYFER